MLCFKRLESLARKNSTFCVTWKSSKVSNLSYYFSSFRVNLSLEENILKSDGVTGHVQVAMEKEIENLSK